MKKPMKFNLNWDIIFPVFIALFSIICEIILIIIAIKEQKVSVSAYIMQCFCCIVWTVYSIYFYINCINKE